MHDRSALGAARRRRRPARGQWSRTRSTPRPLLSPGPRRSPTGSALPPQAGRSPPPPRRPLPPRPSRSSSRSCSRGVAIARRSGRSPEEMAGVRAGRRTVPFEAEPRVYRSDLAERLPPGLTMPRAYAVVDVDAESAALWLEDVPVVAARWDGATRAQAAHLLGRLAASPRVRPLATVADPGGTGPFAAMSRGASACRSSPHCTTADMAPPHRRPRVRRRAAPRPRRRHRYAAHRGR